MAPLSFCPPVSFRVSASFHALCGKTFLALVLMAIAGAGMARAQASTYSNPVNFGSQAVGTAQAQTAVTFTVAAAVNMGTPLVVTTGTASLDYTLGTGSTCTGSVAAGTCIVNVVFTPKAPGRRLGAVELVNTSGTLITTALLSGTGTGPMALFSTPVSSGSYPQLTAPRGITVDAKGDVYVTESTGDDIDKFGPGFAETQYRTEGGGSGTAIDGAGNLFLGLPAANVIDELRAGKTSPFDIASIPSPDNNLQVDSLGNLFVTSSADNSLYEIPLSFYEIPPTTTLSNAVMIFAGGTAVTGGTTGRIVATAIDAADNLYLADYDNNRIYKLAAGTSTPVTIIDDQVNLNGPQGLAIDAAGTLYVTCASGAPVRYAYTAGAYSAGQPMPTAFGQYGAAIGGDGTLYFIDGNSITKNVRTSTTVNFASTVVGSASLDSPQAASLENDGNAPLTFGVPSSGGNPIITGDFSIGNGSTCPQLTSGSGTYTLATGASCTDLISFIAPTTGNFGGTLVTTDDTLNVPGSTQTASLNGTDTLPPPVILVPVLGTTSVTPAAVLLGASQSITIATTVTYSGSQPTGVLTFTFNGIGYTATCTTAGSPETCSATVPAATIAALSASSYPVTAALAADSTYSAATGSNGAFAVNAAVGIPSVTQTATVTIATGGTLGAINVLTQGAANKDFQYVAGGTCTTGILYNPTDTCTVLYTFSATRPGQRPWRG